MIELHLGAVLFNDVEQPEEVVDCFKLTEQTGYCSAVLFGEGIHETAEWRKEPRDGEWEIMNHKFEFQPTEIEGLIEVTSFNADDIRGCLTKDYSREAFEANGVCHNLVEVFYTTSHKGVIRALHFQRVKQQPKLVRCIWGHVWDVVVDMRKESPTFMKWLAFDLVSEEHNEILVPAGCAHGYLVLEDSIVSYKCSEKFYGEYDDGIIWDDPDIGIGWPLERVGGRENVILAEKDKKLQSFKQFMEKYGGL